MFSPDASFNGTQAATTRNTRRRQRKDHESPRHEQPRRKRTKLSEETFAPASGAVQNGNGSLVANGHAATGRKNDSQAPAVQEIAFRGGRTMQPSSKRLVSGDSVKVLAKDPNYTIVQLPSLPEVLRNEPATEYRGSVLPSASKALAITRKHALVWDYNSSVATPTAHTFELAFPSHVDEELSVGALVQNGPSSEVGLVVVSPSGKIAFWESVDSAEALSVFRQRRNAIESAIYGMFSGETVKSIIEAQQAGLIIGLSSGRLVQLTLRDAQGKAQITTQYLKSPKSKANGGLFGSVRNILGGGGWLRDIAAVKTRKSASRGQVEVVVLTEKAVFQLWDVSWSGHDTFKGQIDASEMLANTANSGSDAEGFLVHDFEILPEQSLQLIHEEDGPVDALLSFNALLLYSVTDGGKRKYSIAKVKIADNIANISRVVSLDSYNSSGHNTHHKPTIDVPIASNTAFITFADAVVMLSVATYDSTPDEQLLGSATQIQPFQDAVFFKRDMNLSVAGLACEGIDEKGRANCVVCAQGAGLIRFSAFEYTASKRNVERNKITVKGKLEQAISYGADKQNVLDFFRKPSFPVEQEELEEAALTLSGEILRTDVSFIPEVMPSMDEQLRLRAVALKDLALQLKHNYPSISRLTKWRLLWDAEKLAAARAIWKHYDARLNEKEASQRALLWEIIDMLHERHKTATREDEQDPVRRWFIKDVWRIEQLIPWGFNAVKELQREDKRDRVSILKFVSEGDDVTLGGLETAFDFRSQNIDLYGLGDEKLEDGILTSGFEDLPEFWTSTYAIMACTYSMVKSARAEASKFDENATYDIEVAQALSRKIGVENVRLVQVILQVYTERYRYLLTRREEGSQALGEQLQVDLPAVRQELLVSLAEVGQVPAGMQLAEKYRDMKALVGLINNEKAYMLDELQETGNSPEEEAARVAAEARLEQLDKIVASYFKRFGDDWAKAYYSNFIMNDRPSDLLDQAQTSKEHLTRYLRSSKSRAKLSWINDVKEWDDYARAGNTLKTVAEDSENNVWSLKVELSLAKLAYIAAKTQEGQDAQNLEKAQAQIEQGLEVAKIQERLYNKMKPSFYTAIDEDARIKQMMSDYGRLVEDQAASQGLMKEGFTRLLVHKPLRLDLLVDLLTLMDPWGPDDGDDGFFKDGYYLALKVLHESDNVSINDKTRQELIKIVWKRCFIRDDWASINNTGGKSDEDAEVELEGTLLFRTLKQVQANNILNPTSAIEIIAPSEVLGAGCANSSLKSRFSNPDLWERIIADNQVDDDTLSTLLEKYRLGHWFRSAKDAASKMVKDEADAQAEKDREDRDIREKTKKGLAEADERERALAREKARRSPVRWSQSLMNMGDKEYDEDHEASPAEFEDPKDADYEDEEQNGRMYQADGEDETENGESAVDSDGDVEMDD